MFLNATKCDIYIGTSAGAKLIKEIENAEHSVKILSPFLSPFLVQKLIGLHHRNINIQLITTDTIEDFYGDRKRNIYELIQQQIHTDTEAKNSRKQWTSYKRFTTIITYLLTGLAIWVAYAYQDAKAYFLIIPILLLLFFLQSLKSKIARKRVFSYSYKKLFPFKVVVAPDKYDYNGMYLHGKMYIIDDRIAYLGSLNFTGGGTKKNYETRIRFGTKEAVDKMVYEFDELFNDEKFPEVSIQSWGKQLYPEPIN